MTYSPDFSSLYIIFEVLILCNSKPCHSYQTQQKLCICVINVWVLFVYACMCLCVCAAAAAAAAAVRTKACRPTADRESAGRTNTLMNYVGKWLIKLSRWAQTIQPQKTTLRPGERLYLKCRMWDVIQSCSTTCTECPAALPKWFVCVWEWVCTVHLMKSSHNN